VSSFSELHISVWRVVTTQALAMVYSFGDVRKNHAIGPGVILKKGGVELTATLS
jgi:hypothetical protein